METTREETEVHDAPAADAVPGAPPPVLPPSDPNPEGQPPEQPPAAPGPPAVAGPLNPDYSPPEPATASEGPAPPSGLTWDEARAEREAALEEKARLRRERLRVLGGWALRQVPDAVVWGVLFVAAFAHFGKDATSRYSFDAIAYAAMVENHTHGAPLRALLHPHHLLFNVWVALFWKAAALLVPLERSIHAAQLQNALLAATGISGLYLLGRRTLTSRILPIGLALVGASLFGYRFIAADGGIYAAAMAPVVMTLWAAAGLARRATPLRAAILGVVAGAAVLLHQMHVLLVLTCLAAPLLSEAPWRRRLVVLGWLILAGTLTVMVPYVWAGLLLGKTTPDAFRDWVTEYGRDGRWWSWNMEHNLRMSEYALAHVFLPDAESHALLGYLRGHLGLALGCGLLFGGLIACALWSRDRRRGRWVLLAALWIIPYMVMFTIWVPGYYAYWVPVALGLLLLLLLGLDALAGLGPSFTWRRQEARIHVRPWAVLFRAAVLFGAVHLALLLGHYNDPVLTRYRSPESNPYLTHALELGRHTERGDMIVMAGTGSLAAIEPYVPYFAQREVLTLDRFMKRSRAGDERQAQLARALATVGGEMNEIWKRGRRVYVLNEVLFPVTDAWPPLIERYGVDPDRFTRALRRYPRRLAFHARGRPVYELVPMGATPAPDAPPLARPESAPPAETSPDAPPSQPSP